MKLFEFEAKNILKKQGISFPRGDVAYSVDDVAKIAQKIGGPVVLKSQVLVSGRGKAGGILFADDIDTAQITAKKLFGSLIKGNRVTALLVEEKISIVEQLYASVTIDRPAQSYVVLASLSGGIDIEEVARTSPDKIVRHTVDMETGFDESTAKTMVSRLRMSVGDAAAFSSILGILYKAAMDYDAELVELNPLVKTSSGQFIGADARMTIDDNALFRHPEFQGMRKEGTEDTAKEAEAKKLGFAYVDLDGDIGIIGNGAGLVMATLDVVQMMGGKPANFLDIGGNPEAEVIKEATKLVLSKPGVKAILLNILGGIARCDNVARGVIAALNESSIKKPVVARMMGTNEEEGTRLLNEAGIQVDTRMEDAIAKVVKL